MCVGVCVVGGEGAALEVLADGAVWVGVGLAGGVSQRASFKALGLVLGEDGAVFDEVGSCGGVPVGCAVGVELVYAAVGGGLFVAGGNAHGSCCCA